jgi:hypothetical protein
VKNFVGRESERSEITMEDIDELIDTNVEKKTVKRNIITRSSSRRVLQPIGVQANIMKNMKKMFERYPYFVGIKGSRFINASFSLLGMVKNKILSEKDKDEFMENQVFTDQCVKVDKDLCSFKLPCIPASKLACSGKL